MPPADPPAQETLPGSALKLAIRSAIVLCGEPAGTTITSYSSVSRASGVASDIFTGELAAISAPTITMPATMTVSP